VIDGDRGGDDRVDPICEKVKDQNVDVFNACVDTMK